MVLERLANSTSIDGGNHLSIARYIAAFQGDHHIANYEHRTLSLVRRELLTRIMAPGVGFPKPDTGIVDGLAHANHGMPRCQ